PLRKFDPLLEGRRSIRVYADMPEITSTLQVGRFRFPVTPMRDRGSREVHGTSVRSPDDLHYGRGFQLIDASDSRSHGTNLPPLIAYESNRRLQLDSFDERFVALYVHYERILPVLEAPGHLSDP